MRPIENSPTIVYPRWSTKGTIVAQNFDYDTLTPMGFDIESDDSIVVIDHINHKIDRCQWKNTKTSCKILFGVGNSPRQSSPPLNYPTDVVIYRQNESLLICDRENRRVVRVTLTSKTYLEVLISGIDCYGLALDHLENLYVSNRKNHSIYRWNLRTNQGSSIIGGRDRGNRIDQLNSPQFVFVDRDLTVYVSDYGNSRVMKWKKNANDGILVAGDNHAGAKLSQLSEPNDLFVDEFGAVYIVDSGNRRVVRWRSGAIEGELIVGGDKNETERTQFGYPIGLAFDQAKNLYVSDYNNNVVLKFERITTA